MSEVETTDEMRERIAVLEAALAGLLWVLDLLYEQDLHPGTWVEVDEARGALSASLAPEPPERSSVDVICDPTV